MAEWGGVWGSIARTGLVLGPVTESHCSFPGQEAVDTFGGRKAGGGRGCPGVGICSPRCHPAESACFLPHCTQPSGPWPNAPHWSGLAHMSLSSEWFPRNREYVPDPALPLGVWSASSSQAQGGHREGRTTHGVSEPCTRRLGREGQVF